MERRAPILGLKIDVTASLKELFRDGLMTNYDREVERGAPMLVLQWLEKKNSTNKVFEFPRHYKRWLQGIEGLAEHLLTRTQHVGCACYHAAK